MNRRYRLRKRRDFARVYRRGKSQATRLMALVVARGARGELKIGFSVSKKIGKAVVRNRVKRRMREAVRLEIPDLRRGYRLIFVARGPIERADYAAIRADVRRLLQRTSLYAAAPEEDRL